MPTIAPGIPFTRRQGLQSGLTEAELFGPGYVRLYRGCFVSALPRPTLATQLRAAMLLAPDKAFVTHESAAQLYAGAVPESADVHLGTLTGSRSKRDGITLHRYADLPPMRTMHGLTTTTPERTFVDLAERLPLLDLVVLGDSLLRRRVTTRERLTESTMSTVSSRGIRAARRAATFVRDGVDSPQESRLRMLLVLAGLPEPAINVVLRDPDGEVRRRLDLGYLEQQLAVEYDGRQHITSDEAWRADLRRREELGNDGWTIVVVTAHDLRHDPAGTIRRVKEAMTACGMRVPRTRDDWRRHFPASRS
ncbi:hypothetical protein [Allobranchiibius sp. GilTou73]|uniref:hypothetical protein n=1 Tax=Allobranchiibius sp. GilTou73 TaxID=2904523 RepID=UPI001F21D1EA|nr:hypothetical protein [Allobranchiibius sp. GilTou73]UIJ33387.1 hypothetical protein LVQ62_09305 [Allobranchiibius sp. GilTou73]